MYHLVKFVDYTPVVYYSCECISSLRRFVNSLDVPYGGMSFGVYDFRGHLYGIIFRLRPFDNASFSKHPRYGTKDYLCIYYAKKAPNMGSRSRGFLDRHYPLSIFSDVVRFYPEDSYIG